MYKRGNFLYAFYTQAVLRIYILKRIHTYTFIIHYTRFEYVHVCHAIPCPKVERPHAPTSAACGGQVGA